jgi:hypothetical protein
MLAQVRLVVLAVSPVGAAAVGVVARRLAVLAVLAVLAS